MSSSWDRIQNIGRELQNIKKRIFILYEGERTEAKYIDFLEKKFSSENNLIEIINCGAATLCDIERLKEIREMNENYYEDVDESFYLIDLDIFDEKTEAKNIKLAKISEEFQVIYSKETFVFWILLHYESKDSLSEILYLDEDEMRVRLRENHKAGLSGKKIREANEVELMNKLDIASNNAEILRIEKEFKHLNIHNYMKIITSDVNITNMDILIKRLMKND